MLWRNGESEKAKGPLAVAVSFAETVVLDVRH